MLQLVKALHRCPAKWTVSPLLSDLGLQIIHSIHWPTTPACQSVIRESQFLFCIPSLLLLHSVNLSVVYFQVWKKQKWNAEGLSLSAWPFCHQAFVSKCFLLCLVLAAPGLLKYISFSLIILQTQTQPKDTLQGRKSSALFALRGHLPWRLYSQFILKLLFIHSKWFNPYIMS